MASTVGIESDIVVTEEEVRCALELAISVQRVFVARAVDPQIAIRDEPFRMCQKHASDLECAETKLVRHKDLASPTDTAALVAKTELTGNNHNIMILLLFT